MVELDPGMAFGTGRHPTTRMCLELLEETMGGLTIDGSPLTDGKDRKPSTVKRGPVVLDLGTGSGLLAIAAFRLGAGAVVALDTDQTVCQIASENIRRNGGIRRVTVKHGSLEVVGGRTFDVVLANLTAEGLRNLAPRLVRSVRHRGALIVSGILKNQERGIMTVFRRNGMIPAKVRRGREWVGLMLLRPGASRSDAC
jgi:ribosomal protein L11 methyltransferase